MDMWTVWIAAVIFTYIALALAYYRFDLVRFIPWHMIRTLRADLEREKKIPANLGVFLDSREQVIESLRRQVTEADALLQDEKMISVSLAANREDWKSQANFWKHEFQWCREQATKWMSECHTLQQQVSDLRALKTPVKKTKRTKT